MVEIKTVLLYVSLCLGFFAIAFSISDSSPSVLNYYTYNITNLTNINLTNTTYINISYNSNDSGYLFSNGSRQLTSDWNAGAYGITAEIINASWNGSAGLIHYDNSSWLNTTLINLKTLGGRNGSTDLSIGDFILFNNSAPMNFSQVAGWNWATWKFNDTNFNALVSSFILPSDYLINSTIQVRIHYIMEAPKLNNVTWYLGVNRQHFNGSIESWTSGSLIYDSQIVENMTLIKTPPSTFGPNTGAFSEYFRPRDIIAVTIARSGNDAKDNEQNYTALMGVSVDYKRVL